MAVFAPVGELHAEKSDKPVCHLYDVALLNRKLLDYTIPRSYAQHGRRALMRDFTSRFAYMGLVDSVRHSVGSYNTRPVVEVVTDGMISLPLLGGDSIGGDRASITSAPYYLYAVLVKRNVIGSMATHETPMTSAWTAPSDLVAGEEISVKQARVSALDMPLSKDVAAPAIPIPLSADRLTALGGFLPANMTEFAQRGRTALFDVKTPVGANDYVLQLIYAIGGAESQIPWYDRSAGLVACLRLGRISGSDEDVPLARSHFGAAYLPQTLFTQAVEANLHLQNITMILDFPVGWTDAGYGANNRLRVHGAHHWPGGLIVGQQGLQMAAGDEDDAEDDENDYSEEGDGLLPEYPAPEILATGYGMRTAAGDDDEGTNPGYGEEEEEEEEDPIFEDDMAAADDDVMDTVDDVPKVGSGSDDMEAEKDDGEGAEAVFGDVDEDDAAAELAGESIEVEEEDASLTTASGGSHGRSTRRRGRY